MKELTTTYKGIEITYDRQDNVWRYTLRGKERRSVSLQLAETAIDDARRRKDKIAFKPIKAYYGHRLYSSYYQLVTVTSLVDSVSYGRKQAWIEYPKGVKTFKSREKVYLDHLYAATPENDKIISQAQDVRKQADRLKAQADTLLEKLTPLPVKLLALVAS